MIITIDGPTASGKSSVANAIAIKLGINHLNSGLLFRALAYALITYFDYNEEDLINAKKEDLEKIFKKKLIYIFEGGKSKVIYDNRDLTPFLKSKKIDQAASILSTLSDVRHLLLHYQREYAKVYSTIVDGRDSGSVVFPNADFKFYLTASPEIRAERWRQMQLKKGKKYSFEQALEEINTRDKRDENRNIAPLIIPKDAIVIDSSNLTLQETVNEVLKTINYYNLEFN